jgi:hypothetical protein
VRFGDYAEIWPAERDFSPKTAAHYRRTLRGRLAVFANFALDEFTPMTIKRW